MPLLTRYRLRLLWYCLIGCVTIAFALPGLTLHGPRFAENVDDTWVHFLLYMALAALPLLGWRMREGIVLASGMALLSVVLQVVHGFVSGRGTDTHCTTINLLGVAAGVLLGLNIRALRASAKDRPILLVDRRKRPPE
jgi:hypothetical protein